jgi:hypothetical protein
VTNEDFVVSNQSSIIVEYAPEFYLGVNKASVKRKITHGEEFNLNCDSHEFQEASTRWFYSDKNRKNKIELHETSKVLKLPKMRHDLAGYYECIVGNLVGNSTKTFKIEHVSKGERHY